MMILNYFIKLDNGILYDVEVDATMTVRMVIDKIYDDQKLFFDYHERDIGELELYAPSRLEVNSVDTLLQRADIQGLPRLTLRQKVEQVVNDGLDANMVHLVIVPRSTAGFEHAPLSRPVAELGLFANSVIFEIKFESDKPKWDGVVSLNRYLDRDDLPSFVNGVVETPRRPEGNDVQHAAQLLDGLKAIPDEGGRIAGILHKLSSKAENALPYVRCYPEIFHYVHAFRHIYSWKTSLAPGASEDDSLTFDEARSIIFEDFRLYWTRQVEGAECTFDKQLQFPLIAKEHVEVEGDAPAYRKYQPRPEVAFLKHSLPRFLAEFDSHDNYQDEHRLCVQMACVLSLALAVRRTACIEDKSFFLMGAFFDKGRLIHRYFFYVDELEQTRICFHKRIFKMSLPDELTTFLYEFYNYAKYVKDDDATGNMTKQIATLREGIESTVSKALYTTKHSKKCTRSQSGQDDADHGSSNLAALTGALQKAYYQVQCYDYPEDFEPLDEVPAHIVRARSPIGEEIVAKLPHKNCNELSLLEELSSQKSPHNHAIPLLDTVPSSLGRLIILPLGTPLSTNSIPFLFRNELKGKFTQLSRELVEGVAFLHRQKIAHLDIKPDNLVYNFKSKRLYIIDFDVAMRCKDVDELIELSCGTRGWSAPEIVHDDNKPLRAVSPIRADLWSCGKVLRFLAANTNEQDTDIMSLTNLLMHGDPRHRPLLHEVMDEESDSWTFQSLLEALKSQVKLQQKTSDISVSVKLKRARDNTSYASKDGLTSKILKTSSASSTLPQSPLDSSPDSSFDPLSSSSVSDSVATECVGKVEDYPVSDVAEEEL